MPRSGGRRTKLTPELQETLCAAVRAGTLSAPALAGVAFPLFPPCAGAAPSPPPSRAVTDQVATGERMSFRAAGFGLVHRREAHATEDVFATADGLQVRWIDAGFVAAEVI